MKTPPAAIVWDLDGTLVDSAPDIAASLNQLLGEHGFEALAQERVRGMIGDGAAKLIERGFAARQRPQPATRVPALLRRFESIYMQHATRQSRLFAGARSVLEHFADAGVRQGICTNKPEAISRKVLHELGIAELFDVVVGGDTLATKKPQPQPLLSALDALGAGPRDSLMVGDSEVDVHTARAAAMSVVLVTFGYCRGRPEAAGADFLIGDLRELPGLLATAA